ncbi:RTA1 like protein-domain-containing protein [Mycena rosella]|uniref:RTA1 like protein-domain-containing protein n=1 Tax=Mycena rosella TaxID=1033263 RepID=A0AAD7GB20_MYCRO|nr:RTA1 like protein-domain-containing protein [Mycena rosella]
MAVEGSQYGYIPEEFVAIMFLVFFGISTMVHIGQATYYRMWWMLLTACQCGLGEVIGWSGRAQSSTSAEAQTLFTPSLLNFILLSWIVTRLGPCYSRLAPPWYAIILLSCDSVALVIQCTGSGIVSNGNTMSTANLGANIMLAGIVVQFVTIITYCTFAAIFLRRYLKDHPVRSSPNDRGVLDPKLRTLIVAVACSTLLLSIRCIYRIIQLATGWTGRIIQTEAYFDVFDGAMVLLAMVTFNLAHPGRLLLRRTHGAKTSSTQTSLITQVDV